MEEGKKRLAVLVGCNYPNTPNELHGCINDVRTMREVLIHRFGFEPVDVEVLTDEPGSRAMPTGSNIRRALESMADRAEAGDVLFFHYSGHGTRVPAVKGHRHGSKREEAIVPCDFNLITDVDFRQLVNQLPPGASFTIVSDSCHSGGLIDKEKEQIGPSSTPRDTTSTPFTKTIPFESVLAHLASLTGLPSPDIEDHLSNLFGTTERSLKYTSPDERSHNPVGPDDGILLSGCQADETSADVNPEEEWGLGKACGAFSNAIQEVLKEHPGRISNRELVMRARARLSAQRFAQHPCLYCSDENADAAFLWQPEMARVVGMDQSDGLEFIERK
ncbi:Metacaspase-9 [Acorus gramineus]|uniref:Metacaspase-9 n=1 Tax=Acorus gramineus TaxID=55184 RepID=A0AAV9BY80_ACOGR|nr:Metacaspase-9 [Acorus gramineus]